MNSVSSVITQDLCPGWDGVGEGKISSQYSELHAVENLQVVYFSGIFHLIFLDCCG
jgi:hypothetical protein